ncbi:hypothetical protein GKZ89_08215 [Bacillus mangrovi]|uniref:N(G),N(G)-dimethylarginine dimethylaminohydrolase n=1 Tax=Metabacillus mangrovi TaxID=1491830 RepID=A0A7X2V4S5_9BACI|nr:dimethylarginine dimethylaminohydrolase family protein [Metabacillus mangrovi]MTH53399.1 hypothetical protein [Metabacillus mangrovi]
MNIKASCHNEYGKLKSVLLCPPKYLKIEEIINETQRHYKHDPLDAEKAERQHKEFIRLLQEQGIRTSLLEPDERYPEQVFTRDIGFVLGDTFFIANMEMDIRFGEEAILKNWLEKEGLKYVDLKGAGIEGGDVLIDGKTVYIGISERTSPDSVPMLAKHLPDYDLVPLPIKEEYLHLDCVFNILSEKDALLFPDALSSKELELLKSRFDVIEVKEEDQFRLGVNVLSLGNKKLAALPQNKHTNDQLRERGYDVVETDISEIIKSGGAFRCCTLALERE